MTREFSPSRTPPQPARVVSLLADERSVGSQEEVLAHRLVGRPAAVVDGRADADVSVRLSVPVDVRHYLVDGARCASNLVSFGLLLSHDLDETQPAFRDGGDPGTKLGVAALPESLNLGRSISILTKCEPTFVYRKGEPWRE